MIGRGIVSALGGVLLFAAQAWAAPGPYYVVTNLGIFPTGTTSAATALNEKGQIVGYATVSGDTLETRAFLWFDGEMIDLGTLGGTYSAAYGINNNGVVVGESTNYSGYLRAFAYNRVKYKGKKSESTRPYGEMVDLGLPGEQYSTSSARGINDSNSIVGYVSEGGYGVQGVGGGAQGNGYDAMYPCKFNYIPSKQTVKGIKVLDTFGGPYGMATAIRGDGVIVGWASLDEEGPDGFIHHAFVYRHDAMVDMGTLPGEDLSSAIYALNGNALFVGASDAPYYMPNEQGLGDNAVLWTALGQIQSLGALPGYTSVAYGVNSANLIVGECSADRVDAPIAGPGRVLPPSSSRAFIWDKSTGILDLNSMIYSDSLWVLQAAYAVNNKGWIVGVGTYDGETRAFLLQPVLALPATTTTTTTSTTTTSTTTTSTSTSTSTSTTSTSLPL